MIVLFNGQYDMKKRKRSSFISLCYPGSALSQVPIATFSLPFTFVEPQLSPQLDVEIGAPMITKYLNMSKISSYLVSSFRFFMPCHATPSCTAVRVPITKQ